MSGVRSRLAGVVGADPGSIEQLTQRLDELERSTGDGLDRHGAAVREVAADLAERLAAIERRLDALEAAADA
jgi:tetrahydromethanopterin S-methyltransferase subunit G